MNFLNPIARALLAGAAIIALVLGAVFLLQNRLLYYPTREQLPDYVPEGLKAWPEAIPSAEPILGLVAPADNPQTTRGTVIVFHGNAGHAGHRGYYARQLSPLGFRTILAEYPGYGPRSGKPDESTLVDDAVAIVELAHATYGDPLWLIGESLGAGVAAAAAARTEPMVKGMVLITPWNRLEAVASHHYPWLPVRWLLQSRYDSVQALELFNGPKLILLASNDRIVPASLGRDLYTQLPQPKKLIELTDAGHNDWIRYAPTALWRDTMQWLLENEMRNE